MGKQAGRLAHLDVSGRQCLLGEALHLRRSLVALLLEAATLAEARARGCRRLALAPPSVVLLVQVGAKEVERRLILAVERVEEQEGRFRRPAPVSLVVLGAIASIAT